MRSMRKLARRSGIASGLATLVVGAALFTFSGAAMAQDPDSSETCGNSSCHNDKYQAWKASGHPFILMEAERAQNRPIPLPEDYTWNDISYVIGGYKRKSRYLDKDGYIITQGKGAQPGNTQYNYLTGEWVDYNADQPDGTLPYNCGSCHTTGWVANDNPDDTSGNQGGLPGIWGTFDEGGIHCVQCHGGSQHADFGAIDSSAEACGTCHHRTAAPGSDNAIPAGGGFIKHHEQYNEFLASGAHGAFMECTSCHDPHFRAEFSIKEDAACEDCHDDVAADYAETVMYDYQVECIDCHMPLATKSGQETGPFQGDVQTHIFRINSDPNGKMFTDDGAFVALDNDGNAAVTMDFACKRCHVTASLDELGKFARDFHDPNVGNKWAGLTPGLTGTWWGGQVRSGEGFLIEFANAGPNLTFFGSFYTYDPNGNQVWMTMLPAAGAVPASGTEMDVLVYITEGGKWGDDFNSADVNATQFGTGTLTFPDCESGTVQITPDQAFLDIGFTAMGYDLSRDLLESKISCPTFNNNAGTVAAN